MTSPSINILVNDEDLFKKSYKSIVSITLFERINEFFLMTHFPPDCDRLRMSEKMYFIYSQ